MNLIRRFFAVTLVAVLSMTSLAAFAQDEAATAQPVEAGTSSFASGIGNPATLFDERGNPTTSMVVTEVVIDWDGYDEYEAPSSGMMYVLVTIEHTNHGNRPVEIQPQTINLVDNMGLLGQTTWFGSSDVVTIEPITVEPGGVGTTSTVYAVWADSSPMMVMFQPVYTTYGFVHLPAE